MIRTLIVDDDPLTQEDLMRLIGEETDFQISGVASNGADALKIIEEKPIDVLFLDVEMPGLSGLEVASRLTKIEQPPLVVFVTAHQKYAIEAFEKNAIDYLLKPYQIERFKKALGRIRSLLETKPEIPNRQKLISLENDLIQRGLIKKLAGQKRNSKDRVIIDLSDVCYFTSTHTQVFVYTDRDELLLTQTLKGLLMNLNPSVFIQTHKSYVVNLNKIQKVSPLFNGNFEITLQNPALPKIPVSRRFARNLKTMLGER